MEKTLPPSQPHIQFCVLEGEDEVKAAKKVAEQRPVPTQHVRVRPGEALRYLTVIEALANVREDKVDEAVREVLEAGVKVDVKPPKRR